MSIFGKIFKRKKKVESLPPVEELPKETKEEP